VTRANRIHRFGRHASWLQRLVVQMLLLFMALAVVVSDRLADRLGGVLERLEQRYRALSEVSAEP
jgi:hypothetical protein